MAARIRRSSRSPSTAIPMCCRRTRSPKAVDSFSTPSAVVLSGSVAGNDTPSQDGGNLWAVVTLPAHGSLSFQPDGSFTWRAGTRLRRPG